MEILQRALTGAIAAIFAMIFIMTAAKHATRDLPNRRAIRLIAYTVTIAATLYGCAHYARTG